MSLLWTLVLVAAAPTATDQRINLADFGRVVKIVGDTPATLQAQEVESGSDGWPVWTGEDGQSMIAIEWDEPRDIAEAEIEFRHAVAGRDQIHVQYFLSDAATSQPGGGASTPDTFHGRWMTAKADWWAGDRYVGFAFAPMNEELPGPGTPAISYRRTCRLRFILGKRKEELPAVRYLRAYGPAKAVEAKFEVRLDKLSPLRAPLNARATNGFFIDEDGETQQSMTFEGVPAGMRLRFAENEVTGPSRSIITLIDERGGSKGISFLPAEVIERGLIGIPSLGMTIVHVNTERDLSARRGPTTSAFDRIATESDPSFESVCREVVGLQSVPTVPAVADSRKLIDTRYRAVLDSAMAIEVPDRVLNEFYQTQLVRLLVAADGARGNDVASLEAFNESARPVRSCGQARALDVVGIAGGAEAFLNACLALEPEPKPIGRFRSETKGFLVAPRPGGERFDRSTLEHGVVLTLMGQHYGFTHDRRWLSRNATRLKAACDFVTRQIEAGKGSNLLDKDDVLWGEGLLPPGPITGTTAWAWWLTADAWCARGMRMTAEALTDVNDSFAVPLTTRAAAFSEQVSASCREAMLRCPVVPLPDGRHVPMQPIRDRFRGREPDPALDAAHGPVHLVDCGVYAADAPETEWLLRDTEDHLMPAVGMAAPAGPKAAAGRDRFLRYCAESPAGPPPLVPVYLDRGQYRHALRAFYAMLAGELARQAASDDAAHRDDENGVGPALLVWMRDMLVREQGKDLELLAGVPAEWLAKGRSISVRRAPTWFGPMDLSVESARDANRITIRIAGPARRHPEAIRVWVRAPQQLLTVTCNGDRLATFDPASGVIRLPAYTERAEIVITY